MSSALPLLPSMAGDHTNELHQLYFSSRLIVLVNNNNGFYQRGKSYGMDMKLFVAAKYLDHIQLMWLSG
jgi:hypothetical protein